MVIVLCYRILFIVVSCIWHLEVTLVHWGCIQPPFRWNKKAVLKDVLVYLLTAGWDWLWYLMRFCGADWNESNYWSLQDPRQKGSRQWSRFLRGSACTTCAFWVLWLASIPKYRRLPLRTEPGHREFFMVSTVSISLCFGPFPPWAGPNVHFQLLFTFTSLNIIITLQILRLALVGPSSQCLTAPCAPA